MKLHPKSIFVVLFTIFTATSFAQTGDVRQPLFAAFPSTINLDNTTLIDACTKTIGAVVNYNFGANFIFSGTVIGNENKYDNLQMIVIRSTENAHTFFQISKIKNPDNTISYTGRILNNDAADGYALKNNNGLYTLQKFESDKILTPCKF
jgi:hypothetical protein